MQPILLPGAHVLRRDADTLQVGLDPAERVLLPDVPRHRRLLSDPPQGAARALLDPVLVPDDAALRAALPAVHCPDPTALWARHSLASRARRSRGLVPREEAVVLVQAYGGRLGERIADEVRTWLRRSAIPAPDRRRPGPRSDVPPREVHVVAGVGEPPRSLVDDRVEQGVPHLLLRFVEGRAVVGPYVVPGRTACVRCLDLHRTDLDPAWPLLLEQYSRVSRHDRADGVPEPVDAAVTAVALGWVAREVAADLTGTGPLTWSRTLTLTPELVEVVLQDWPRRPDCTCAAR